MLPRLIFDLEFSLLIEYILCRTRLTYNCAHLRSTKESLTFEYLQKENVTFMENKESIWRGKYFFASEKKNQEGNGEKYLEKEFFLQRRRKTEKEMEGNIWRR